MADSLVFTCNYCHAFAVVAPSTKDQTWSSHYQRRLSYSPDINFPPPASGSLNLADVETVAVAPVTLRVTEPARHSLVDQPFRNAECVSLCGGIVGLGGGGSLVRRLRLAEPVCHSKRRRPHGPRPPSRVAAVTALWKRIGRLTAR